MQWFQNKTVTARVLPATWYHVACSYSGQNNNLFIGLCPSTPKISLVINSLYCLLYHSHERCGEFGVGSTTKLIFNYSLFSSLVCYVRIQRVRSRYLQKLYNLPLLLHLIKNMQKCHRETNDKPQQTTEKLKSDLPRLSETKGAPRKWKKNQLLKKQTLNIIILPISWIIGLRFW